MRRVGVGYRTPLHGWILRQPPEIGCLEVTAEHFFDDPEAVRPLAERFPLMVHGLGLSLGSPGPLDRDTLDRFRGIVELANPLWISEHVAFTRTDEVDLGHLNPLVPSRESLRWVVEHARQVADECGKPLILENITTMLRLEGDLSEPEFLNALCEEADCGLLLDVTNLLINSRNHHFDPLAWLDQLNIQHVRQLHVVGYTEQDDGWRDYHRAPISEDLFTLVGEVVGRGDVEAIIIERDHEFPPAEELEEELRRLSQLLNPAAPAG